MFSSPFKPLEISLELCRFIAPALVLDTVVEPNDGQPPFYIEDVCACQLRGKQPLCLHPDSQSHTFSIRSAEVRLGLSPLRLGLLSLLCYLSVRLRKPEREG